MQSFFLLPDNHKPRLHCFFTAQFADKLSTLHMELTGHFAALGVQEFRFGLPSPFIVDVENTPGNTQMELIELQCNGTPNAKYYSLGPEKFCLNHIQC